MSSNEGLWMSFTATTGPKTCTPMPLYVLSLVFDDGAWVGIETVRVIVVRKHREGDAELFMDGCNSPDPFDKWASLQLTRPRDLVTPLLKSSLRSSVGGRGLQRGLSLAPGKEKTCCIILEYACGVDTTSRDYGLYGFRPIRGVRLSDMDPQCRILWERTYQISAEDHSVLQFLTSSHLRFNEYKLYYGFQMRNNYVIRILPSACSRRTQLPSLPTPIITKTVRQALNHYESRWSAELLNYALVQKSWVHVLELFWILIGDGTGYIANPTGMAHAIGRQPHMGKHIVCFKADLITHYYIPKDDHRVSNVALLSAASHVREVSLNGRCFSAVQGVLPNLQFVKKLECHFYDRGKVQDPIDKLQECITGWKGLEEISISFSETSTNPGSLSEYKGLQKPQYSLKSFIMGIGSVSGSRLVMFFAHPIQRLTTLRLSTVSGLGNEDFSCLFGLVSRTLLRIHIETCFVSHKESEERALDVHLPNMVSIQDITIQADLLTPLSIILKPGHRSGRICILNPGPEEFIDQRTRRMTLPQAMPESSWASVKLKFMNTSRECTCDTFMEALTKSPDANKLNVVHRVSTFPDFRDIIISPMEVGE